MNPPVASSPQHAANTHDDKAREPQYCPVFQHVMELLGRRWTGVILRDLLRGPARFSDLRRSIPGLSDRLLVERLNELEFEGFVERLVTDELVTYQLTAKGEDLRAALSAVSEHAEKWAATAHLADRPGRRCLDV